MSTPSSPCSTSPVTPCSPISSNNSSFLEDVECINNWIDCFAICSFDIELGQKIDFFYPSTYSERVDKIQQSNIAYLAFPDGGTQPTKNITNFNYAFRLKDEHNVAASENEFVFGHVVYRQKKDSSVHRGYVMKSLVLLTRHPYIKLHRYLVQRISDAYFIEENINVLHDVMTQINKWPYPKTDFQFALPFQGHRVSYRTPSYTPHPSIVRFLNSTPEAANSIKTNIYKKSKVDIKKDVNGRVSSVAPVTPLKERLLGRKYVLQHELNFYRHFKSHLSHLHHMWELVLSGEPILVLSPTAGECSSAVMALVSLIAPIPYKGDYRPYFTVHNSEFRSLPNSNIIIGVTNPFFVKALQSWDNVLALGKSKPKKSPQLLSNPLENLLALSPSKLQQALTSGPSRESLTWEFKECFITKSKTIVKGTLEGLVDLNDDDKNREGAETLNNDQIKRHFEELTESFLLPLHMCFDSLVCSLKTFIVRSEHEKVFKKERFYEYSKKKWL
ncbi:hypothetical protein AKO1_013044 [Acrasis kona]|uniref:UDENN domain-containing protein n=1 Tax=Acrasis kona TaxID=1008807 RepID=A0AAW2Z053_9EUKA